MFFITTNESNYISYIFNRKARKMVKEIERVSKENEYGLFKLEQRELKGRQKIRHQYTGRFQYVKGTMLNRISSSSSNSLYTLDLVNLMDDYVVVPYSKPAEKMPNRFLAAMEKRNKKAS